MREHTPRQPRCPPQLPRWRALAADARASLSVQAITNAAPDLFAATRASAQGGVLRYGRRFERDIRPSPPWPPTRLTAWAFGFGVGLPARLGPPPSNDAILLAR